MANLATLKKAILALENAREARKACEATEKTANADALALFSEYIDAHCNDMDTTENRNAIITYKETEEKAFNATLVEKAGREYIDMEMFAQDDPKLFAKVMTKYGKEAKGSISIKLTSAKKGAK